MKANVAWSLFVEGPSDQALVRCLLDEMAIDEVEVESLDGGVSKLATARSGMTIRRGAGRRVALVLDADDNPVARQAEVAQEVKRHALPVDRRFLLPDNKSPGCLETLLLNMVVDAHLGIFECFDQYEACLGDHRYQTPDLKARVYAYCHALAIETGAKKNYRSSSHWNLAAPCLDPLREFLRGLDLSETE